MFKNRFPVSDVSVIPFLESRILVEVQQVAAGEAALKTAFTS